MFNGDPKVAQEDLKRYAAVTPQDVTQTFARYITGQPAVVLSVVPMGASEMAAKPADFPPPETLLENTAQLQDPAVPATETDTLPQPREVHDSFDRNIRPRPGINPVVQLPPIHDGKLANGVRMLSVKNDETPTVTMRLVFDMGQRDEPPGKAGLAGLTANLMNEATTERSAAEFSEALERIGANVDVSSGQYQTTLDLDTLATHLEPAMALVMERLLKPAFTAEDFDRIKSQTLESLRAAQKSGPALAGRAMSAALAGPTHPLSYPASGLPSTVESLTLDDVKAFYAAHIPSHLNGVLVSTSVPQEEIDRAVQDLGQLPVARNKRENIDGLITTKGRTIFLVDKPGSTQSSVRIGHPSLAYDAVGEYYRANLMNFALGGSFDSRINLNLREDKGWTYGAYTGFNGGQEFGSFQFSGEINSEATGVAIAETLEELEKYSTAGMTETEFRYMQSSIGQSDAMLY
ncbi:MAG: insulinase family protein, partial [Lysobacterales bacterium]